MAEWNVEVPDDLDARVRSYLSERNVGLADFVHQAVREQLLYEADAALQAEITARIKRGMNDVDGGHVQDAEEAMREIADKHGLKLGE